MSNADKKSPAELRLDAAYERARVHRDARRDAIEEAFVEAQNTYREQLRLAENEYFFRLDRADRAYKYATLGKR